MLADRSHRWRVQSRPPVSSSASPPPPPPLIGWDALSWLPPSNERPPLSLLLSPGEQEEGFKHANSTRSVCPCMGTPPVRRPPPVCPRCKVRWLKIKAWGLGSRVQLPEFRTKQLRLESRDAELRSGVQGFALRDYGLGCRIWDTECVI